MDVFSILVLLRRKAVIKQWHRNGAANSVKAKAKAKQPLNKTITKRKDETYCYDCGEHVHWTGDAERSTPGAGSFKPRREIQRPH